MQALRFHIEIAHTSIGVHNEYFLHHRRSGGYHLCCRLHWSARLNMKWKIRLAAAIATAPFGDGYSRTNGFVCQPITWLHSVLSIRVRQRYWSSNDEDDIRWPRLARRSAFDGDGKTRRYV